jgi:hypothetical protein
MARVLITGATWLRLGVVWLNIWCDSLMSSWRCFGVGGAILALWRVVQSQITFLKVISKMHLP